MSDPVEIIRENIAEINPEARLADGFEAAIIGIACRACAPPVVAYSREKCVEILMERDGMTYEMAEEFFDYNVAGAYVGEGTPVFIDTGVIEVG